MSGSAMSHFATNLRVSSVEADMWRRTLATVIVLFTQLQSAGIAAPEPRCDMRDSSARFYIQAAVTGALRRLQSSGCQQVLSDFTNAEGVALRAVLDDRRTTVAEFAGGLHFVDGSDTPQCRRRDELAAFTAPGSHVIFVCADGFMSAFHGRQKAAEILMIHEMLHAIGLGERPPSSTEITAQVTRRCGSYERLAGPIAALR
jgi:hypothetical protein